MSVSETQDGVLRRVRSAGDLPRRPERAYIHSSSRVSESTSNPYDFACRPRSAQIIPTTSSLPPLQQDTNANSSLTLHTQNPTLELQPPIALHVKILSFFGLGRRATRERKLLVSVIWNILWGFVQVRFRFICFYQSKLGHILVRSNHLHADSDCNPFQERL